MRMLQPEYYKIYNCLQYLILLDNSVLIIIQCHVLSCDITEVTCCEFENLLCLWK